MDDNIFNYMLEITGLDNRIHSDANGNFIPHMEFKESNYFLTLCEAVESLLLMDIRKFERQSGETDNDRYCEYAAIRAIEDKEPMLEIFRLSFESTLKGSPAAGIYMHFCDSTTEKFERLTGYDLSRFSAYDPNSPFLQLASYAYDKGFKISVDEELTDRANSLKSYEQSSIHEDEWNFKVSITRNNLGSTALQEITNYHYPWLQDAFIRLLGTDINEMDKQIAERLNKKSWIEDAHLSERGTIKLLEFITAKDHLSGETVAEPGIHLKFHTSIENIEAESGIGLAQLGNYGQNDKYLLVANYYKDFIKLLAHPGYLSLLARINTKQPLRQPSSEQEPYQLQVTWASAQSLNEDINYPQQQITPIACSSLEEALFSMKKLGERFFDEQQAYRQHYPLYVKQADIIDGSNSAIIVSKFHVREKSEQLPAGIYIKLNEDYVSMELIKLLRSHLKETQVNSRQLLITDTKSLRLPLSEDTPERKNRAAKRTINPRDGSGLKM